MHLDRTSRERFPGLDRWGWSIKERPPQPGLDHPGKGAKGEEGAAR